MNDSGILVIGALLHDIGKIVHRANGDHMQSHSRSGFDLVGKYTQNGDLLDCVRYHHKQDIINSSIGSSSPAYIVCIADNISSGVDKREIEGDSKLKFDKHQQLASVFNILNKKEPIKEDEREFYDLRAINEYINFQGCVKSSDNATIYGEIQLLLEGSLRANTLDEKYINSLLEVLEKCLTYVPTSIRADEWCDISLFDHAKTTAAIAACIQAYLEEKGQTDYKMALLTNEKQFCNEQAFILLSMDISGIQQFIYSITSKGALKGLRARSFYLELLLENTADELLQACGLSRANLIYTGGGHAYLLLPNTKACDEQVKRIFDSLNKQLRECFKTGLYISYGSTPCSANTLMNKTENPLDYSNIFKRVATQISQKKLFRYRAQDIIELNSAQESGDGRECGICGVSDSLIELNGQHLCGYCAAFEACSGTLIKPDAVFVVTNCMGSGPQMTLFGADGPQYMRCMSGRDAAELLERHPEQVVRIYSKNRFEEGLVRSTKLWMGDYAAKSDDKSIKTFSELALRESDGISRLGVLRADVDNLGNAFVNGFSLQGNGKNQHRYATISRTATLSRSLSLFFKYHINGILERGDFSLNGALSSQRKRNVTVVYSGGDDMFIVGEWEDVLCCGIDIRNALKKYTQGTLTISAGLGIFEDTFPISQMAKQTGELEQFAKSHENKDKQPKNAIALFGSQVRENESVNLHTYDWDTLQDQVLGEKFALINRLMDARKDLGNSFLYNIVDLIRKSEEQRINIARLAYLLARRECDKWADDAVKEVYDRFSKSVYKWATDKDDARQLLSALLIYVYINRESKEVIKS